MSVVINEQSQNKDFPDRKLNYVFVYIYLLSMIQSDHSAITHDFEFIQILNHLLLNMGEVV